MSPGNVMDQDPKDVAEWRYDDEIAIIIPLLFPTRKGSRKSGIPKILSTIPKET